MGSDSRGPRAPGSLDPESQDWQPEAPYEDLPSGRDRPTVIKRDRPDPPRARAELVKVWNARVMRARQHWKPYFERMRMCQDFALGKQWPNSTGMQDDRYICNIALRHVSSRTAAIYASNPTITAKRRERMVNVVWDGTLQSLAIAQQNIQMAQTLGQPPDQASQAILEDATRVHQYNTMLDRVANSLRLLYNYNVDAQVHNFKVMMKLAVRRGIISGVAYVKLGFQRAMRMRPDIEARIADMSEQLATIERLAADLADEKFQMEEAKAEELRLAIKALANEPQLIVREGLVFDYPESTAVIPDLKCKNLREFLGADWVAEEYMLLPEQIEEIYKVDVGQNYRAWKAEGLNEPDNTDQGTLPYIDVTRDARYQDMQSNVYAIVWQIYNRKDRLIYTVCDGYPDFLQEPSEPDVYTDRFWPWYPLVFNECYHSDRIFPPSDIELLWNMQLELNRARQGLREHRQANRPKIAVAGGRLEEEDKAKLRTHPANAVIELNALQVGEKIDDLLQPFKMPPIDPALYDTNPSMEDMLRVLGQQQADTGQTDRATATETAVAQAARGSDLASTMDDMDGLLTQMAHDGGQILLMNVSQDTVNKIVGDGAVWPDMDRDTISRNVYLEVQAGSTGRPNKAQEVQNAVQLVPLLQRVPGISPEWLANELIKRMDDRLDLSDAFAEHLPSMEAMNSAGMAANGMPAGGGPGAPNAPSPGQPGSASDGGHPGMRPADAPHLQGPQGQHNAPGGPPTSGITAPRIPAPIRLVPPPPGSSGMTPGTPGGGPRTTNQTGQATP
jgi:hypothetical protein